MQNLIKTLKKYDIFVYILAILLLLLIASFSFSHTGVTNSPETTLAAPTNSDNWQDNASYRDTDWEGSGTSSSPYLITSAQELAGMAYVINSGTNYNYFKLTQDIDLSDHYWTPIGSWSETPYRGNFDGNYCNISGLYINGSESHIGLFGYTRNANISNISLTNGSITGNNLVGGIVGYAWDSTIQNCSSDIIIEGSRNVGGIVGFSNGSNINNCANLGMLFGNDQYIGGIVGYGSSGGSIEYCYNIAGIYATNCSYVGGIVGSLNRGSSDLIWVRYCINYSQIISHSNVGGIVGSTGSNTTHYGPQVSYCANVNNIIAESDFGGIVGSGGLYVTIYSCYNTGNIMCLGMGPDNDDVNMGGIVGDAYHGSIRCCYNTGDINTSYGNGVGGILGSCSGASSPVSISGCFNLGSVYTVYGDQSTTGEITGSSDATQNTCYTASQSRPTDLSWFTNTSNWHFSARWDFSNAWGLSSNYNNNYPYLRVFTYNVNFDLGDTTSTLYCSWGTSYEFSTGGTKEGYVVSGWTSADLNRNYAKVGTAKANLYWDGSTTEASHFADLGSNGQTVTLTANWEEIQYDVQIEYNDGVTSNRTISNIPYLTVFNVPNPTRTAYNFAGWSSSNKDDTALVGDSATSCTTSWTSGTTKATFFSKLTSTDGRTVILTANWEPKQYTITFDLDGGTGSTSMTYTINGNYTLPEPNKTGHTFTGWQFVSQSGEGNWSSGTYSAGTSLNGKYGNISLRATWRANTYTLTFDPQGGSVSPTSIQVTYGQTYGYHNGGVLPTPTLIDNNFSGWCTQFGDMELYERGALDIYTIAGDSTLYAYWTDTWNMYTEKPGGNGTTASPYLISEPEHLGWLSYEVARGRETTAVCKQTANIDLIQSRGYLPHIPYWYSIGTPNYPFRGSYDGNGFKIEILQVLDEYKNNVGIFGYTNGARIDKIYVSNTSYLVHGNQVNLSTYRNTNIAGIIAYAQGSTILSNSAFYGQLATTENMTNKGALIGNATSSVTISDCVVFPLTTHDNSSLGISGGNPRIESCVYVINGVKGYTFTGYTDSTETNFVIADYLSAPVPAGLSWLAYGGERATLAEIKAWANS